MLKESFIGHLQCPQSGQAFILANSALLTRINEKTESPWHSAIVTTDEKLAYPVADGIPQLLPELAVQIA